MPVVTNKLAIARDYIVMNKITFMGVDIGMYRWHREYKAFGRNNFRESFLSSGIRHGSIRMGSKSLSQGRSTIAKRRKVGNLTWKS